MTRCLLLVVALVVLPASQAHAQQIETRTAYTIDVRGSATVTAAVGQPLDCSGVSDGGAARSGSWKISWRSPQRLPMRRFRHPSTGRPHYFAYWRLRKPTRFTLRTDEHWDEQVIDNPYGPVEEYRCSMLARSCTGAAVRRERPQHRIDTYGRKVRFELAMTEFPGGLRGGCAPRRFRIDPEAGMPLRRLALKTAVPLRRLTRGRAFTVRIERTIPLRYADSPSAEPWERWRGTLDYTVTWRLRPAGRGG